MLRPYAIDTIAVICSVYFARELIFINGDRGFEHALFIGRDKRHNHYEALVYDALVVWFPSPHIYHLLFMFVDSWLVTGTHRFYAGRYTGHQTLEFTSRADDTFRFVFR